MLPEEFKIRGGMGTTRSSKSSIPSIGQPLLGAPGGFGKRVMKFLDARGKALLKTIMEVPGPATWAAALQGHILRWLVRVSRQSPARLRDNYAKVFARRSRPCERVR